MVPWQRSTSVRLSNAWDTRCITNCASGSMRRSAVWRNDVTEVTIATVGKATSTIARTRSGRIAATAVVVTATTNEKRKGRTVPLPTLATRRSSHSWCMGRRASTPPRIATKTPRIINVKFKTKKPIQGASQQRALYKWGWQVAH